MHSLSSTWRIVKLGQITTPVERIDPSAQFIGKFNYIDISAVDNASKTVVGNLEREVEAAPGRARQLVFPGDVLVSTVRPALNAVAVVPPGLTTAVASTGFCVLRPQSAALLPEYLFHFVTARPFIESLVSMQKGGAYPAVSDDDVRAVSIPLPPLSEQQRIVEILQEAEAIRRLRAEAEAKTAELIPAMFFDRFVRDQDHECQPLHKLAEVVSGVAVGRKSKGMSAEVPYLRVANVQAGYVDLSEVKSTPASETEVDQFALKPGDVLLTEGGDFDKLGRGCLWEGQVDPCIHQNHVFRVRAHEGKLNPRFFAHYLQSAKAKHYFLRCAKKTTNLASINLTQLKALPVPNIPIDVQEAFELWIERAAECSSKEGEVAFSALTDSLSAHAFSGQLTTAWREAHAEQLADEARERDAALAQLGTAFSRARPAAIREDDDLASLRADGIYSDLNREQRALLSHIHRRLRDVDDLRYFTAEALSRSIEGPLRRNPQAIQGHLTVLAARGLIIPLSREEQTEDTAEFVFGNGYRLPLLDRTDRLTDESGNALIIESGEYLVTEGVVGDHARGRELERLAVQLEKERELP